MYIESALSCIPNTYSAQTMVCCGNFFNSSTLNSSSFSTSPLNLTLCVFSSMCGIGPWFLSYPFPSSVMKLYVLSVSLQCRVV